ncbi:MAG: trypsin-like peptidase domain-containing protein [Clostridia bacterium]|nr:trypsin-like peptidase domain-containing protein [Clostridia bacterium]
MEYNNDATERLPDEEAMPPETDAPDRASVSEQPDVAAASADEMPRASDEEAKADENDAPDDAVTADAVTVDAAETENAEDEQKEPLSDEVQKTDAPLEAVDAPTEAAASESNGSKTESEQPPAAPETVVRYRWNYETQRATDEQLSARKRRSGILTYAIIMTAFFAVSFVILVASLLTGGLTGRNSSSLDNYGGASSDRIVYIREDDGENGLLTIQEIAEQSKPGVVAVTVKKTMGQGVGTGFVLTEDGYIATNYHVVQNGVSVQVSLYGGETYEATVINYSEPDDLAVLKIDATDLPVLPIGDSDDVLVGDDVVVIGHPAGLEYGWSTTNGIVSAINREVKIKNTDGTLNKKMTLLQTNANVNSGNSGGPMLNERGEVIGIISMKLADGYEGMGFAIPINGAMEIVNAIIENGSADHVDSSVSEGRPVLGITGMDVVKGYTIILYEDGTYSAYPTGGVPADAAEGRSYEIERSGFLVAEVDETTDAYGKLQEGDVIFAIDGVETSNRNAMMAILDDKSVGDEVVVDCLRDGEIHSCKITLSPAAQ